jgi:hypothetical protein
MGEGHRASTVPKAIRCVWSFRDRSPGKYWRFAPKLYKDGPENSKRIVAMVYVSVDTMI